MPDQATPREVLDRLLRGITERRWEELADLYAEDTVVEHPLNIPEPTRIEGREQIRRHFANAARLPVERHVRNVIVHQTTDPEVIIAEYDRDTRITTSDRTFASANIMVMRIRDGQIVTSRDYHDHFAFAVAHGRLPEIVAALADTGAAADSPTGAGQRPA